ncbi:hypothetical protein J6590_043253 [Homalodisca vitripennis]|nr:hypothetical protein J6590_043253 [Homalodisca vitripennis]
MKNIVSFTFGREGHNDDEVMRPRDDLVALVATTPRQQAGYINSLFPTTLKAIALHDNVLNCTTLPFPLERLGYCPTPSSLELMAYVTAFPLSTALGIYKLQLTKSRRRKVSAKLLLFKRCVSTVGIFLQSIRFTLAERESADTHTDRQTDRQTRRAMGWTAATTPLRYIKQCQSRKAAWIVLGLGVQQGSTLDPMMFFVWFQNFPLDLYGFVY